MPDPNELDKSLENKDINIESNNLNDTIRLNNEDSQSYMKFKIDDKEMKEISNTLKSIDSDISSDTSFTNYSDAGLGIDGKNNQLRKYLEQIVRKHPEVDKSLYENYSETISSYNTIFNLSQEGLHFDNEDIEKINKIDTLRNDLDEFNKKTEYAHFSDPQMSEIYTSLRYVQKLKNEFSRFYISKESAELKADNEHLLNGYLDELSIDYNELSEAAKKANMVYGPLPPEQKEKQNAYLDNIKENATRLSDNKALFDNAQKELSTDKIDEINNSNEIVALSHLKNVIKLEQARQTLITNDAKYTKCTDLLESFKQQKKLLLRAKTKDEVKFTDHTNQKHYQELQLINEKLDEIFADPDEVDQKANDSAYIKITNNAKEIFPDKTDKEIAEKLKSIEEIYEKDIDEVKEAVTKAMDAYENKYGKNSPHEAEKIEKIEKNIILFENRLKQMKENGDIEKSAQFKTLTDRKNKELKKFEESASKTYSGDNLIKIANELKGKELSNDDFNTLINRVDSEIAKRELTPLVNRSVEKTNESISKYAELNRNAENYIEKQSQANTEVQKLNRKIYNQINKTDNFLNHNSAIAKIQEKAKKMLETIDLGKRIGHTDSKEFENMKNTLRSFSENPNKDTLEAMTNAATKYQEQKKTGYHIKLFTTGMRAKRLNTAAEIIDLGEQFNTVNTQLEQDKAELTNLNDNLANLNPAAGIQNKIFAENEISEINSKQQSVTEDLENNITKSIAMKSAFISQVSKDKALATKQKAKENEKAEMIKE